MTGRLKISKILEKLNDIPIECSDIDDDEICDSEEEANEIENELRGIQDELLEEEIVQDSSDSDSDYENILNVRKRKHARVFSSSEDENDSESEVAADGTVWKKMQEGPSPGRLPLCNIIKDKPGPTGYAKKHIMKNEVSSAFFLLIDNPMLEHIRSCTELEASRVLGEKWTLTKSKLIAFIGILYARGAYEAKNLKLSYLWNRKWGPNFFSNTMSRNDFTEILRFIRFDKKSERRQRLQSDKFALISATWDRFIQNSQNCFKPGANITIDEQLFSSKARCRFTQYMPNKPDKFGIKFWLACDVETKYIFNGFPYLGKDETRTTSQPLSEFVVLKLIEPFTMKGRNVTTDNFFTSLPLASKLLSKNTTLVGTIRGNKRYLPKICQTKKDNMARFSSLLYKSNECVLTIYKSKPKKKVFLLSTQHNSISIDNSNKQLPETVTFYNKTKFGVDTADQMAKKYSVKSGSRRWPLQVFFNILDLACINAWILYKETTGEKTSRKDFMFQLADELSTNNSDNNVKPVLVSKKTTSLDSRKWCQIGLCHNNKTTNICNICKKYVCGKCTEKKEFVCKKCAQ